MKAILNRRYEDNQTFGILSIFDKGEMLLQYYTLELKNMGNIKKLSCIPEGEYGCEKIIRPDGRNGIWIKDVPNRSAILIHPGNFATGPQVDIEGCIMVGSSYKDINKDGAKDITGSVKAFEKLFDILPEKFKIEIFS